MKTTVVAGNPKAGSRTLQAGILLAEALAAKTNSGGPSTEAEPLQLIDVIELGPGLLGWEDAAVKDAVATASDSDLLIVASPTFKASYTGVLKLFLDQFDTGTGLAGVTAVALMLGAGPTHALAPELLLKPVLVELGATTPAQGLYLNEKTFAEEGALEPWLDRWADVVIASAVAAGVARG
ncbi:FMN reductase [Homoserinimonas aerilata]|uniref:FMN reductase n=1 Tax=Homoserinimonas aerilata TaxID=1162970 RepID=A0A542XX00_9MICO|nr:NAD(P)H-dependent oxidoreductase [Homoserinimonas aerilata]TQL40357.1 FMN reductase [Homoserinimonas aerilata]